VLSNQTNMVFIGLPSREMGEQFADSAAEQGVKVIGGQRMRLVTHLDIDEEDIAKVIASFRAFFAA
ncbi:MAG: low-specificity L-threonine aldolase, partial [Gammaproteobacteria bacterium]|nr:low-specificity L-threonine aldolase [Gammaproteobacteria bacterium]